MEKSSCPHWRMECGKTRDGHTKSLTHVASRKASSVQRGKPPLYLFYVVTYIWRHRERFGESHLPLSSALSTKTGTIHKWEEEILPSTLCLDTEVWSSTQQKSKTFTVYKQSGTQLQWVNVLRLQHRSRLMLRPTSKHCQTCAVLVFSAAGRTKSCSPSQCPIREKKKLHFYFFSTLGTAKQKQISAILYYFFMTKHSLVLVYTSEIRLCFPSFWRTWMARLRKGVIRAVTSFPSWREKAVDQVTDSRAGHHYCSLPKFCP